MSTYILGHMYSKSCLNFSQVYSKAQIHLILLLRVGLTTWIMILEAICFVQFERLNKDGHLSFILTLRNLVTMLYITSPELTHLRSGSLYHLTSLTHFSHPALATTHLFPV